MGIYAGNGIVLMIVSLYYLLFGFALSRLVYASFANGVFDKYLNPHIEGAQVGQGLRPQSEDDELPDEDDEEDDGEEGFDFGDEETTVYEVQCACGNIIDFDEDVLESGSIVCDKCGETLEFSFDDDEEDDK